MIRLLEMIFSIIIPADNEEAFIGRCLDSIRKFDEFGDWFLLKNPRLVRKKFQGNDQKAADHVYYDVHR